MLQSLLQWTCRCAALLLALLLCGCGGATPQRPGGGPDAVVFPSLESPDSALQRILREVSDVDEPLFKSGSADSASLPRQSCSEYGNRMNFYPDWTPGGGLAGTAYCGYVFDLTGYADPVQLTCAFATAPDKAKQVYLGVANFARNAWDWFELPLCGTVDPAPKSHYASSPDTLMLVMLVCIGSKQLQLANIRVGNTAPTASFTASTSLGIPGTIVTFDASASNDPDGTIYSYKWDPEGDGTYLPLPPFNPHGSATLAKTYSQPGTYHPTLKVTDDSGASDTTSATVKISLGNFYSGTLDAETWAGGYCSAALVNGRAAVAYMRNEELRYMHALDAEALNWSDVKVIDPDCGGYPDLAVIAGRPAIAYQSGARDLAFVRASTASGSSWPAPSIAYYKTSIPIGYYPTLAEANGVPLIVYIGKDVMDWGGIVWCVRAVDEVGSLWLNVATLNPVSTQGDEPALGLIAGMPVVSYMASTAQSTKEVQVVRASDSTGEGWLNPAVTAVADSIYPFANGSALIEASGRAAVGFIDTVDDTVRFARASDIEATGWNASVTVADPGDNCHASAFCNINGLPCCAYDGGSAGLYYVIATTPSGSSWNPPLPVDASADPGFISLIAINGLPAFAYYDGTADCLKFAIYN